MTDPQYAKKACEEVVRLADEKIHGIPEFLSNHNEVFNEFIKATESSQRDINHYFNNMMKQMEKLKNSYLLEIKDTIQKSQQDYESRKIQIQNLTKQLEELRERTVRSINSGTAMGDSSLIYQVHNAIFNLQKAMDFFDEYDDKIMPLKFVGKMDLSTRPKCDIGVLERLLDISGAEILPIKLPKIKLGQLFCLTFRLGTRHCPAAEQYLSYSVTKDSSGGSGGGGGGTGGGTTTAGTSTNALNDNSPLSRVPVDSYLKDLKDGSYQLSFPITAIVPHAVKICYMGHNIKNSPYTILFKIGANATINNNMAANQEATIQSTKHIMANSPSQMYGNNNESNPHMIDYNHHADFIPAANFGKQRNNHFPVDTMEDSFKNLTM